MLTDYSAPLPSRHASVRPSPPPTSIADPPSGFTSAWRYPVTGGQRSRIAFALLFSAALHAAVFFGAKPAKPTAHVAAKENVPVIELRMPDLKDLDEPDPVPATGDTPVEAVTLVPMQPDLPQVVQSSDFVQQIDIASLIQKPDLSNAKVFAVPDNINRSALRQNIGKIFNIADLDRAPEPLSQPAPVYPITLKREGVTATVRLQFIVDSEGRVVAAEVVDSSNPGFNEAAVQGVYRWKFRAGVRGGRRVNTRMEVPIIFKINEDE